MEGGLQRDGHWKMGRDREKEVKKNNTVLGNHWLSLLYREAE